ncbi:MAG: GNAT family N-acetyltransferase [Vicingaceae bacterium]|nr:GNAT family N-acetyltransferase [Vicingaceae bacterium]
MELKLNICNSSAEFELAKKLTKDYMDWLGEDLCYQGIEKEMETFHIMYNKPIGAFIYVLINGEITGGIGVRKLEDGICEMKRLFVYEKFRGHQLGLLMCEELLKISKNLGYKKMRLDTLPKLKNAVKLYESLGFYETAKYYNNPDERVNYMEIKL